jgi:hypothetical protein
LAVCIWTCPIVCPAAQRWDIVYTETPHTGNGDGSRLILLSKDGSTRVLTPDFHSAADPAVSFDGARILFAGRRSAAGRWNVYEMNADGSQLRQITRDFGDCRSPVYQSPIFYLDDPRPMPQIAFVSDSAGELATRGSAPATALYSARLDGSGIRRLTYTPSGAFHPCMLPDGRMLFSAWNSGPGRRIALFAVNIDGTDFAAFSGGQGFGNLRMACVTSQRQVVFIESGDASKDGSGSLAVINLRRNLHSYRRLTATAQGAFHSPSPLPDGILLAARRPTASGSYGIYRIDPATGKLDLLQDAPDKHEMQPQALAPREVPDGRSSVVDEKETWAKLYCLNLYRSDLDAGVWKNGLVKRIRILEAVPRRSPSAAVRTRFLGEFDADEDGSFQVQLPANVPVQVQTLDGNGMALRSSAWIWAKNKEQRGCIGCHEDGELTPENAMASALARPAISLMLPPERRRTVDFDQDVAPVVKARCGAPACHGGAAFQKLFSGKNVTPGSARTSRLVWAVFGKNTSRPWDRTAAAAVPAHTQPAPASTLTPSEKRTIVEWIDLGAHLEAR